MLKTENSARAQWIERARALLPLIDSYREQTERERRIPQALVDAMADADLFKLWVPSDLGGAEVDLRTCIDVVEEVSYVDASVGWNLQIGAGASLFWGYLPADVAQHAFSSSPRSIMAGSLHVTGKTSAIAVSGGYRVTGRWGFATGCEYATWLMGSCTVFDGDAPRLTPDGRPDPYLMFFPRVDAEVIDTWNAIGLRGTGSHDIAVADLFVPEECGARLFAEERPKPGALFSLRFDTLVPVLMAPVATAIARAAIDALVDLASVKTPARAQALLRERSLVQADVARAEALLGSARAFLFDVVEDVWATALSGAPLTLKQRARLRLATANAVASSAQVVDLMYTDAGGSSVYVPNILERCFRDIHVVTQHASVSPVNYEPIGRVFLGMEPGIARF